MRFFLKLPLIAASALLLLAGTANAWTLSWLADKSAIGAGEAVTIDIFLDSDGAQDIGLQLLGVGVLADTANNMGALQYDEGSSSVPGYILYTPGNGTVPSAYLIPSQDPPTFWPAPPAGMTEVIVNWQEATLLSTNILASNTLIGTLVYEGGVGFDETASLEMIISGNGATLRQCTPLTGNMCTSNVTVNLPADLMITVPEPAAVGLSVAALFTLAGLRRWRRDA